MVSLSKLFRQRVTLWNGKAYGALWKSAIKSAVFRPAQAATLDQQRKTNATRAICLVKRGAYFRADQALKSDIVHSVTSAVAETLPRKLPQELQTIHSEFEFPDCVELPPLPHHHKFSTTEVMEAVLSFPNAVAAGGSGFEAAHLTELP